ncbi:DUF5979 domain-containing protein [Rathayibacter sp. YIM 133350]|uniref:DUF5979 domain-containing protein n=1 Tax=Rathayibacter sp. YIM 133350 TaxID=3131992 RepID=UPI00307E6F5B
MSVATTTEAPASAAELDAITSVTIVQPSGDIAVGDTLELSATWAVPSTARSGDTFSLNLPTSPLLTGLATTFDLLDPDDQSVVGSCVVTQPSIVCTLGDYVDTHIDVEGTLTFWAKAQQESTETTLTFTTGGGTTIVVPTSGIGPAPDYPVPVQPSKRGELSSDGTAIGWSVWVPSDNLVGQSLTLVDTYDPGLTFVPPTTQIGYIPNSSWNDGNINPADIRVLTPGTDFTVTDDAANSTFTIAIHASIATNSTYLITYFTVLPPGVEIGDSFGNTITGSSFWTSDSTFTYQGGGGTGDGDGFGGFTMTKSISGDAAALVPPTTAFTVDYSYTLDDAPVSGTLTLTPGVASGLTGLPEGTLVTLTERGPPPVPGLSWGAPLFAGDSLTAAGTSAQFVIGNQTSIAVSLTNPVTTSLGNFTVNKSVTGNAADLVPPDTEFTIGYSFVRDGSAVTGVMSLTPDGSTGLTGLPDGTVVTLTEGAPPPINGMVWGTPTFSGDGVTANGNTAQFTIDTTSDVTVALSNPAARVFGDATLRKSITGNAADLVPASTTFAVDYSYVLNGIPVDGTLALTPGSSADFSRLPQGTVVTLAEETPPAVPGVTWGTPVFSGEGVTVSGNSAQLVIGDATDVAVTLTNPALAETPSPTPSPTPTPAPAPAPGPASTSDLASTGIDAVPALIIAGLMLLAGVVTVVGRAARRPARR